SVTVPFRSVVEADMARRSLVSSSSGQQVMWVPRECTVNATVLSVSVFQKTGVEENRFPRKDKLITSLTPKSSSVYLETGLSFCSGELVLWTEGGESLGMMNPSSSSFDTSHKLGIPNISHHHGELVKEAIDGNLEETSVVSCPPTKCGIIVRQEQQKGLSRKWVELGKRALPGVEAEKGPSGSQDTSGLGLKQWPETPTGTRVESRIRLLGWREREEAGSAGSRNREPLRPWEQPSFGALATKDCAKDPSQSLRVSPELDRWTTEDPVLFRISINAFLDQLSLVMRSIQCLEYVAAVKRGQGRSRESSRVTR
ncbi:hypothetical protein LEMLEM_LOCUS17394, partial [Lemmus lemmus]